MHFTLQRLTLACFCLTLLSTSVLANTVSHSYSTNSGYESSATTGSTSHSYPVPQPLPSPSHRIHHNSHHKHSTVVVSVTQPPVYVQSQSYVYNNSSPQWIESFQGANLPAYAVRSGREANSQPIYVCRAPYNGGMHPGKLTGGVCYIGWGGSELPFTRYQALITNRPLGWAPASNGYIPQGAVIGGDENGQPLFICKAHFQGGIHSGKIIGRNCNFGWRGKEISLPNYQVLVS